jgi:peptidoglycan/xylan/chitin deacetylase (PgdA/CDA1 family)
MDNGQPPPPERGVFTLSLDFELIWGALDRFGPERFRRACEAEREVVGRLLDLFAEYGVSATWCVLGHLFLDRCALVNGRKHPEIVPPTHAWVRGDWFAHDPCAAEEGAPTFLGRSLVDKIRACRVPQEIGSHSFSHVIFGDPGCSRATAQSEIAACVCLARALGLELRSFAFPRNRVGHLDVLRAYGFACYRGPDATWYERRRLPAMLKRVAHLWAVVTAARPPVVLPRRLPNGLVDIPGSMIYFPMHGLRRYIPVSLRVRRACKGLAAAARQKRVFHLWFHPTNLADRTEAMFAGLRAILGYATDLRGRGQLAILPMGALAPALPSTAESPHPNLPPPRGQGAAADQPPPKSGGAPPSRKGP